MSYFATENQNGTPTEDPNQNDNQNQTKDWLAEVVQEKGDNWRDPQTLAKGYANSQEYIKQLEQQSAELREDLSKAKYGEELLKEMRSQASTDTKQNVLDTQAQLSEPQTSDNTSQVMDEQKLASLIDQTLTQREAANTAAQNLSNVNTKLTELFGTEVDKVMTERSTELGMPKERLQEIASQSPTAFFKLLGEEAPVVTNPVTKGTVNTAAGFNSENTGKRNFQYYQKMRRENSNQYYSPKVQNQMLQDRLEQGDSFY